jgi:hypothetical protein
MENRASIQIFIDWFNFEQENYGTPTAENIIKQANNILLLEKYEKTKAVEILQLMIDEFDQENATAYEFELIFKAKQLIKKL